MFAALTAVGAFIRIPFALSAITLQFFFTAMAGLVLGAGWGAASQAVYVLLGLVGLPYMAMIFDAYRGQPLPFWKLIRDGMLIFLPGDMLKIAVCMLLAPQLTKRLSANIA